MSCTCQNLLAPYLPKQPLSTIDPEFLPAELWIRAYDALIDAEGGARDVTIDLLCGENRGHRTSLRLLPANEKFAKLNYTRVERLIKTLLWMVGGAQIRIDGADELIAPLSHSYANGGERAFDNEVIGHKVYGHALSFEKAALKNTAAPTMDAASLGGHSDGCRIGFDLGGSDRKCAAMVDGEVVFSEEIPWDPYFQSNPDYHLEGIRDTLKRAAAHMPRVDAIGGSAAGVYVDNEPRIASLFRGVGDKDFKEKVIPIFHNLQKEWGGIPFAVANDGDVSALAGANTLKSDSIVGISMGTSLAVGYVDPRGQITGWLNELAFIPIDYRHNGPRDEWSGDDGCGVQYFSQQGVQRLASKAGFDFEKSLPAPELLVKVQKAMAEGDERAKALFTTIGICFGYTLPLYARFYSIKHMLLLGRVLSGEGGNLIIKTAKEVIAREFPELTLNLTTPDEAFKRHGQAVAAATLPALAK